MYKTIARTSTKLAARGVILFGWSLLPQVGQNRASGSAGRMVPQSLQYGIGLPERIMFAWTEKLCYFVICTLGLDNRPEMIIQGADQICHRPVRMDEEARLSVFNEFADYGSLDAVID